MLWINPKAHSSEPETTTTERFSVIWYYDILQWKLACLLSLWSGKEPSELETLLQQNKCCNDPTTCAHTQLLNKVTICIK